MTGTISPLFMVVSLSPPPANCRQAFDQEEERAVFPL